MPLVMFTSLRRLVSAPARSSSDRASDFIRTRNSKYTREKWIKERMQSRLAGWWNGDEAGKVEMKCGMPLWHVYTIKICRIRLSSDYVLYKKGLLADMSQFYKLSAWTELCEVISCHAINDGKLILKTCERISGIFYLWNVLFSTNYLILLR